MIIFISSLLILSVYQLYKMSFHVLGSFELQEKLFSMMSYILLFIEGIHAVCWVLLRDCHLHHLCEVTSRAFGWQLECVNLRLHWDWSSQQFLSGMHGIDIRAQKTILQRAFHGNKFYKAHIISIIESASFNLFIYFYMPRCHDSYCYLL